jgi:anion-transporting  ArsA/GET3 family ATPase
VTAIAELLADKRVCVCAGSGGVGKTTTSAAIALGEALRGRRVVLVTIDPAKRLADSLGVEALGGEPHQVDLGALAPTSGGGELWALMLDPKGTFDDIIERLAPDAAARDDILSNRIYQQLSSAVAGAQEYTAMAKLHDLALEGGYDLVVLDTPPSRHALDFLEAPERLVQFLEGRALRVLLRPAGIATRVVGGGTSLVFSALKRLTGIDLLADLSTFFRSLSGLLDGFKRRAAETDRLLREPTTTFLVVTSPAPDPLQEGLWFLERLKEAGMPFGGAVVNRARPRLSDASPAAVEDALEPSLGADLAGRVAASWADHQALAQRDAEGLERLEQELGGPPLAVVPELAQDVHDLAGLAEVATLLRRRA